MILSFFKQSSKTYSFACLILYHLHVSPRWYSIPYWINCMRFSCRCLISQLPFPEVCYGWTFEKASFSLDEFNKLIEISIEFQRNLLFTLINFSAEPIFVFKLVIIFVGQRLNDYCILVRNPKFNSSNVRFFTKQKTRNDNWLLSEINLQTKKSTLASVNGSNFCIHVAR